MPNPENLNKDPDIARERGKLGGRPKGSKNFSTRVKELLSGISKDKDWTSPLAAEKIEIIFGMDIVTDKNGNPVIGKDGKEVKVYRYPAKERQKAIDSILDRIEGKPQNNLKADISGIGSIPKEDINKLIEAMKEGKE